MTDEVGSLQHAVPEETSAVLRHTALPANKHSSETRKLASIEDGGQTNHITAEFAGQSPSWFYSR